MLDSLKHNARELALLGAILVLATAIRAWSLGYDLPFIYHPDEPGYIAISQRIFATGDLNPHFFNYPSLFFYINALAYAPYLLLAQTTGFLHSASEILPPVSLEMGVSWSPMLDTVLLGRAVSVAFGVATTGLVYLLGRRISGRSMVGILAAFAVAVSPTNVLLSRLATPDTLVTFFVVAALLASVLVYQEGKTWQHVLAGVCVGLAASSKYNGALVVLPLLLALFLRHGGTVVRAPKAYLALVCCAAGFLATTPFAVLDFSRFVNDVAYEARHYATGHAGMEGDTLQWYLGYALSTSGILYALGTVAIFRGAFSDPKRSGLLAVFPVAYFLLISSLTVRNDRTFLPMTPAMLLLAAWFLATLFDLLRTIEGKAFRRVLLAALAGVALAALAQPVLVTVAATDQLLAVDSRQTARIWIDGNLPTGSRIAIESYSPFPDASRFEVQGFRRLINHQPDWYAEQGFDYLVASQGMYGRYFSAPDRYGAEISQYDSLFRRFSLVKLFVDGGFEVRVYRVSDVR